MSVGYLYIWGVREDGPIPLRCLAWSFEVRAAPRVVDQAPPYESWSQARVMDWARQAGCAEAVPLLEAHGNVDGRVLAALERGELSQLLPGLALGHRLRFQHALELLRTSGGVEPETQRTGPSWAEFSASVNSGPVCALLLRSFIADATFPRAALVMHVAAHGMPFAMVDMRRVRVSSVSWGSSGRYDDMSSLLLSCSSVALHALDVRDLNDLIPSMRERLARTAVPDSATFWLGASCLASRNPSIKPQVIEWADSMQQWSRENHAVFPREFREAVRTLLLCRQRAGPLSALPRPLVDMVVARLATHYNVSPFWDIEFPRKLDN